MVKKVVVKMARLVTGTTVRLVTGGMTVEHVVTSVRVIVLV
jgi:hypothetical protein